MKTRTYTFEYTIVTGCPSSGTYKGIQATSELEAKRKGFEAMLAGHGIEAWMIQFGRYHVEEMAECTKCKTLFTFGEGEGYAVEGVPYCDDCDSAESTKVAEGA